jgi:hypothetical protein
MVRRRLRLPRRGNVVFAEAALAVVLVGVATQTIAGYVVAGLAAVAGISGLVRRRGRGLVDIARDRMRDPVVTSEGDAGAADHGGLDLGVAARLLPGLHVAELPTRDGGAIGVAGDGQGFAVVLSADITARRKWALADVMAILTDDPARPAAVQLVVEQRGAGRAVTDPRFGPSRTYRSLPVSGVPLWNRVLVAVRHEPAWAPETVAARGEGAAGARNALAAVAARAVAAAASDGLRLRPVGPAELAGLLRDVGDPGPDCETRTTAWTTSTACHATLSVSLGDDHAIGTLLQATAELDIDRCVLSVAANAIDHSVCAVLRVVAAELALVERAAAQLAADGLAVPLPDAQEAGVVASLPLGGGARSLADLVNQVRS